VPGVCEATQAMAEAVASVAMIAAPGAAVASTERPVRGLLAVMVRLAAAQDVATPAAPSKCVGPEHQPWR